MMHTTYPSRRGLGVTLLEMMVALAITTFVILIVNQLFNEVVNTVGRGTQAGEILQRSRAFDEQLANETELLISGGRQPSTNPHDWFSRMVGPAGRETGRPGGFLVVVQRVIDTPVTLDDALKNNTRFVRSDQLMFIYDQLPLLDQSGKKRLPPLAPASDDSFGGDMRNSLNAEYVRMWYGHVAQVDENGNNIGDIGDTTNSNNPNLIAQDWVLGRHALFLSGDSPTPFGNRAFNVVAMANVDDGGRLWNGTTDVCEFTLSDILNKSGGPNLNVAPTNAAYKGLVLPMLYLQVPLLTSAKPTTTSLGSQDIAPAHTYFMGGVSDFIVEFAGDLVRGTSYIPTAADINAGPDGVLDRDTEGRIKWYTWMQANPDRPGTNLGPNDPNMPVTYAVPMGTVAYPPFLSLSDPPLRGNAMFVWQHKWKSPGVETPEFTAWPWMLRIRYRLHDRRGDFEGRQITNLSTGRLEPEPGAWFETIIPVNHQGVK